MTKLPSILAVAIAVALTAAFGIKSERPQVKPLSAIQTVAFQSYPSSTVQGHNWFVEDTRDDAIPTWVGDSKRYE